MSKKRSHSAELERLLEEAEAKAADYKSKLESSEAEAKAKAADYKSKLESSEAKAAEAEAKAADYKSKLESSEAEAEAKAADYKSKLESSKAEAAEAKAKAANFETELKEYKSGDIATLVKNSEGLPPLGNRHLSLPSSHTEGNRPKCDVSVRSLETPSTDELLEKLTGKSLGCCRILGLLKRAGAGPAWCTEADITHFVWLVLGDMLHSMDYKEFSVQSECLLFSLRPDLSVIRLNGHPVGFVEVKKPKPVGEMDALEEDQALSQAFDYALILRQMWGLKHCFGILTTYDSWRLVWIPEDFDPKQTSGRGRGSGRGKGSGRGRGRGCGRGNRSTKDEDEICGRLHATSVISHSDPQLFAILYAAFSKMKEDGENILSMDDACRAYIKVDSCSWTWSNISRPTPTDGFPPLETKVFYLIKPLGHGSEGSVWLAFTEGMTCAIKFIGEEVGKVGADSAARKKAKLEAKEVAQEQATKEADAWKKQFPGVFSVKLAGRWAVVMPFLEMWKCDKLEVTEEVRTAIKTLAKEGVLHKDLKWRHVGWGKAPGGERKVFLTDFGHVEMKTAGNFTAAELEAKMVQSLQMDADVIHSHVASLVGSKAEAGAKLDPIGVTRRTLRTAKKCGWLPNSNSMPLKRLSLQRRRSDCKWTLCLGAPQ